MLAYGISAGGSDWTEWRVRDLASGQDLPTSCVGRNITIRFFAPDGKGIYYSAFPAPAPGRELRARDLNDAVFFHALETTQADDRKVYERPDHPDWQFKPRLTDDGRWLVIEAGEGEVGDKGLENVYALRVDYTLPSHSRWLRASTPSTFSQAPTAGRSIFKRRLTRRAGE